MEITKAEYVMSCPDVAKCPPADRHEYAFIGRSNVGKSSLINMLTARAQLARTAAKPGKTQNINHYMINGNWYMVDLPGYGYARHSKSTRAAFGKMIRDYILRRENLVCLFVLIDSRHEPLAIDMEFMSWLGENQVPFAMVFTKADKLGVTQRSSNVKRYEEEMLRVWEKMPPVFLTSAEKKTGREELLAYIEELNRTVEL